MNKTLEVTCVFIKSGKVTPGQRQLFCYSYFYIMCFLQMTGISLALTSSLQSVNWKRYNHFAVLGWIGSIAYNWKKRWNKLSREHRFTKKEKGDLVSEIDRKVLHIWKSRKPTTLKPTNRRRQATPIPGLLQVCLCTNHTKTSTTSPSASCGALYVHVRQNVSIS